MNQIHAQYHHQKTELLESSRSVLEKTADPSASFEGRIRELESVVERQNRQIRDLQGLVEHLSYKLSRK